MLVGSNVGFLHDVLSLLFILKDAPRHVIKASVVSADEKMVKVDITRKNTFNDIVVT